MLGRRQPLWKRENGISNGGKWRLHSRINRIKRLWAVGWKHRLLYVSRVSRKLVDLFSNFRPGLHMNFQKFGLCGNKFWQQCRLHEQWIGSPVKMPRSEDLSLRKSTASCVRFKCCKFWKIFKRFPYQRFTDDQRRNISCSASNSCMHTIRNRLVFRRKYQCLQIEVHSFVWTTFSSHISRSQSCALGIWTSIQYITCSRVLQWWIDWHVHSINKNTANTNIRTPGDTFTEQNKKKVKSQC